MARHISGTPFRAGWLEEGIGLEIGPGDHDGGLGAGADQAQGLEGPDMFANRVLDRRIRTCAIDAVFELANGVGHTGAGLTAEDGQVPDLGSATSRGRGAEAVTATIDREGKPTMPCADRGLVE